MKDLITEARELCEKATEGPWNWISDDPEFLTLGTSGAEQEFHVLSSWKCKSCQESGLNCLWPEKQDAAFIARSRTLIPELCDALEKAEAEIEKLKIYLAVSGTPIRNYDTVSTTTYPAPPAAEEGAERERN